MYINCVTGIVHPALWEPLSSKTTPGYGGGGGGGGQVPIPGTS